MTGEEEGCLRMTIGESPLDRHSERHRCHSELPPVIPNGVRNLRSASEGWIVTTMSLRASRHLRFFGVRASE